MKASRVFDYLICTSVGQSVLYMLVNGDLEDVYITVSSKVNMHSVGHLMP